MMWSAHWRPVAHHVHSFGKLITCILSTISNERLQAMEVARVLLWMLKGCSNNCSGCQRSDQLCSMHVESSRKFWRESLLPKMACSCRTSIALYNAIRSHRIYHQCQRIMLYYFPLVSSCTTCFSSVRSAVIWCRPPICYRRVVAVYMSRPGDYWHAYYVVNICSLMWVRGVGTGTRCLAQSLDPKEKGQWTCLTWFPSSNIIIPFPFL